MISNVEFDMVPGSAEWQFGNCRRDSAIAGLQVARYLTGAEQSGDGMLR